MPSGRFLKLVDGRRLDGVSFRPAVPESDAGLGVLTVAALPDADGATPASGSSSADGSESVPVESPAVTGIPFEAGVVAFGPPSTDQAGPLLFFNVGAQDDRGEVEPFGRLLSGKRGGTGQWHDADVAVPAARSVGQGLSRRCPLQPEVIERAVRREPPSQNFGPVQRRESKLTDRLNSSAALFSRPPAPDSSASTALSILSIKEEGEER